MNLLEATSCLPRPLIGAAQELRGRRALNDTRAVGGVERMLCEAGLG